MSEVAAGRYTAQINEPFVVFLIGMRVNRLRAFRKWMPASRAMPEMLNVLHNHPEKGFLGGESFFRMFPLTTLLLTYWRSFDDLERFARSADDPHLGAWKRFNQAVGQDGTVGIWHETYLIEAGQYEAVYGNMPIFGLAKATQHVPAVGRRLTARRRLGGENEPAVPTPEPIQTT
ncbi:MAG: DUF4188 domain-containing protein [Chloroflexota bacterium]